MIKRFQNTAILIILFVTTIIVPFAYAVEQNFYTRMEVFYHLKISEVNYDNKQGDFIKFIVFDNSNSPINLNGLTFSDDKLFKSITQDYLVQSGSEITLTFKSEQEDSVKTLQLFTNHTGLTSTTEQVLISKNNIPLDFICWSTSNPPINEIKDFQKFYSPDFWQSNDINSCINSKTIKIGVIKNEITGQNSAQTPSSSLAKAKEPSQNSAQAQLPFLNTDSTQSLVLNEIFPNPDENDTGKEWLELQNNTAETISLKGFKLTNNKNKSISISDFASSINANSVLLLKLKSGFSLYNQNEKLSLFDQENNLLDQIAYEKSFSGKSFARFYSSKSASAKWLWTEQITPSEANPTLIELTGIIVSLPDFTDSNNYSFHFIDENNSDWLISFNENLMPAPLAKSTFLKDQKVTLFGTTEAENNLKLLDFELPENAETNPLINQLFYLIFGLASSLVLAILVKKKFFQNQQFENQFENNLSEQTNKVIFNAQS